MTTTTIYCNDKTGYWVTLTDNGRGATVVDSKGYNFPMVGADYPHAGQLASSRAHFNGAVEVPAPAAPAPVASPLVSDAQVRSARPLSSNTIGLPTDAQARCLDWCKSGWSIRRGVASVTGSTATLDQLQAMARRGWLDLDHPIRPTRGEINTAGRNALAAYVAKHGEVL
jgi:hypothetical protein